MFMERRKSCSDQESMLSERSFSDKYDNLSKAPNKTRVTDIHDLRMLVATWNVGGKTPNSERDLMEWMDVSPPADIYVLGFQEIVPLNAGNIFVAEGSSNAAKWLTFVQQTLNSMSSKNRGDPESSIFAHNTNLQDDSRLSSTIEFSENEFNIKNANSSFSSNRKSFQEGSKLLKQDIRDSNDRKGKRRKIHFYDYKFLRKSNHKAESDSSHGCSSSEDEGHRNGKESISPVGHTSFLRSLSWKSGSRRMHNVEDPTSKFCLVASKQMVGIFLCVWVRSKLKEHVQDLKISCVSRGLMGYLGNKGSIAISMYLHQTSFCFVCAHLASGEREGDEIRRNLDVLEILKRTRFQNIDKYSGKKETPKSILEHDRVIWLGDLNYRISLSYGDAKELVKNSDWEALLAKDQLRLHQGAGHVFRGWNEGKIGFAPTYKYCKNSDFYTVDGLKSKRKRRTPSWCDRILWHGEGLKQLCYVRGESMLSDHRPVFSIFSAEVEILNRSKLKEIMTNLAASLHGQQYLTRLEGAFTCPEFYVSMT